MIIYTSSLHSEYTAMHTAYHFPHLTPDPSYSFAPPGTRLPSFSSADARYEAELRRILGGQVEPLAAQEERVYRAEVSVFLNGTR